MQLYFAGGETWAPLLLDMGVRNILLTYYYFRQQLRSPDSNNARSLLHRMRKAAKPKGYRFMLDSGAFTYQAKASLAPHTLPKPDVYFHEYMDFVKQYGDIFDVIVEFDIDGYVEGVDTGMVDDWTNELLALPEIGYRVMPVYHKHRGRKWLQDWLQSMQSPLLGISSGSASEGVAEQANLIGLCRTFGKFAHGFGQTRIKTDLKYTPYDSVDSTTWLRADKYGGTCIFMNGNFIVLDHLHKGDRAKYSSFFKKWGLDMNLVMKDDLDTMRKATIVAWRELSNHFEAKWAVLSGGKYPYLYQYWKDHGRMPAEHPLITRAKAKQGT